MVELIATIILLGSLAGLFFVLYRKLPTLAKQPPNGHHGIKKHEAIVKLEKKLKDWHVDLFHKQIFLHKLLSWVKVKTLQVETRIDRLLHGIRKKAQELDKEIKKKK